MTGLPNIADGVKGFLVWIGGSLAGISALLYACGYLVTRSHLHMLGLYGVVDFNNDYYLQEGSKFVAGVTYDIGNGAGSLLRPTAPYLVGIAIAGLLLARYIRRLWLHASARQWARMRQLETLRLLGLLVLFAAMAAGTRAYVQTSMGLVGASNLLFSASPSVATCAANDSRLQPDLSVALLCDSALPLKDAFSAQGLLCLKLIGLTAVAWQLAATSRHRTWLVAPFLVLLAPVLLLLPMDYGALRKPMLYPVIEIVAEPALEPRGGRLFLLTASPASFVLWNETTRHITWLPTRTVVRAEVTGTRNLFTATRSVGPGSSP